MPCPTSWSGLIFQLPSLGRTWGVWNKPWSPNSAKSAGPWPRGFKPPAGESAELLSTCPKEYALAFLHLPEDKTQIHKILQLRNRWLSCLSSILPENSFHAEQNGSFCWELGLMVPRFPLVKHYPFTLWPICFHCKLPRDLRIWHS